MRECLEAQGEEPWASLCVGMEKGGGDMGIASMTAQAEDVLWQLVEKAVEQRDADRVRKLVGFIIGVGEN